MSLDKLPPEVETHQIVIRDLIKVYRRGLEEVIALRGVNFEVKEGEFLSIVGPSGSGKTTLVRLIGALDKPTAGRIFVNKRDITRLTEAQAIAYRRSVVGFVWQFGNLIETLTALQNVLLPMQAYGKITKEKKEWAITLLTNLGLEKRMNHKPTELSGGEAQRVAIAVALANKPKILLGDEITGELDSETGAEVMSYLKQLQRDLKITVIAVTHNLEIAKYGDRILRLRDGVIEGYAHKILGEIAEVDEFGRLVIPEHIRKLVGIKKVVQLLVKEGTLIVKPIESE